MIPAPPHEFVTLARKAARLHSLRPELVCAVIEQESSWNPWAQRYEPAFYMRYIEPQVARGALSSSTEARSRAFSWGLMQVMGQVAREHGFAREFLSELCDPAAGLDLGCRVLNAKFAAANGEVARALLLWNGGGNPGYAAAVLARVRNYVDP